MSLAANLAKELVELEQIRTAYFAVMDRLLTDDRQTALPRDSVKIVDTVIE